MAAYPELSGRAIEIATREQDQALTIRVSDITDRSESNPEFKALILTATTELTPQGEMRRFDAIGPFLDSTRNYELAQAIQDATHSGGDVSTAIALKAPRYGPDQRTAFMDHLEQLHLDRALGRTEINSVASTTEPTDARYGLVWTVALSASRPDEAVRRYLLAFEPFSGRLISVREQQ